jgi:hypothetical protein
VTCSLTGSNSSSTPLPSPTPEPTATPSCIPVSTPTAEGSPYAEDDVAQASPSETPQCSCESTPARSSPCAAVVQPVPGRLSLSRCGPYIGTSNPLEARTFSCNLILGMWLIASVHTCAQTGWPNDYALQSAITYRYSVALRDLFHPQNGFFAYIRKKGWTRYFNHVQTLSCSPSKSSTIFKNVAVERINLNYRMRRRGDLMFFMGDSSCTFFKKALPPTCGNCDWYDCGETALTDEQHTYGMPASNDDVRPPFPRGPDNAPNPYPLTSVTVVNQLFISPVATCVWHNMGGNETIQNRAACERAN